MTRCIAVANQKGGVGKTTTSINLTASLSLQGCKSLLVDLDPQGNATMGSGVDKSTFGHGTYHWLMHEASLGQVVHACPTGYDVVPSNTDLTAVEVRLLGDERGTTRLASKLAADAGGYEFVIIDCPPTLGVLTLNALMAADGVLIPMQCEYYALEGLTGLLETLDAVRESGNERLVIEGIVRTMYDPRMGLTREVSRQLVEHFGEALFRTVIPRNVRLAEAPSHGLPAVLYDRHSSGAIAYAALAEELRGRVALRDTRTRGG